VTAHARCDHLSATVSPWHGRVVVMMLPLQPFAAIDANRAGRAVAWRAGPLLERLERREAGYHTGTHRATAPQIQALLRMLPVQRFRRIRAEGDLAKSVMVRKGSPVRVRQRAFAHTLGFSHHATARNP
jgi:hypothetical protein